MWIYKWSTDIQIIKGFKRSCLYDLRRNLYFIVPYDFEVFISRFEGKSIDLEPCNDDSEREWFQFCLDMEFFLMIPNNQINSFPILGLDWKEPSFISNAIVEDGANISLSLDFLDMMLCKNLLIKCSTFNRLEKVVKEIMKGYSFQNVDFLIKTIERDNLIELMERYSIIGNVYVHDSAIKSHQSISGFGNIVPISGSKEGVVFVVSLQIFTESLYRNVYYNKKVFINTKGETSNNEGGNGYKLELASSLPVNEPKMSLKKWKVLWMSSKGKTDVCNICEFRNMCLDSRLPRQRTNGRSWYHLMECTYNPYIAKWKGEEGYLTLKDCGVISNADGFSIDYEKITKINKELWDE